MQSNPPSLTNRGHGSRPCWTKSLRIAAASLVGAFLIVPGPAIFSRSARATSGTVVVNPGNQTATGWQTLQGIFGEPGPDTGMQMYEVGPSTPPLGKGSLEFRIGSNNNWSEAAGYTGLNNLPLGSLTELKYDTFLEQVSNKSQDFFAILLIDTNGDHLADDFLFFFPANQQGCGDGAPPQHGISQGQWQIWDARAGVWVSGLGLCNAQNFCGTATDPKTLAEYLSCLPAARIINDDAGTPDPGDDTPGLIVGYGGDSVSANFIGNLDNVRVGMSGMTTEFDFDPASQIIVVGPGNQTATGWQTLKDIFGAGGPPTSGSQTYEFGPATPPIGVGSLEFRIPSNNDWSEAVGYTGLNGVTLGNLSQLRYSTFIEQASNASQDFFAILVIDTNGDQTAEDFLFFFPANQQGCSDGAPPQHAIFQNQWQSWDARGGVWVSAFESCNALNFCGTANDPKTLAEYLACAPTARIINDNGGTPGNPSDDAPGLIVGYGGASVSAGFIGNLDNVRVGVADSITIFDFEPCVPTCPANVVQSNDLNQCGAVVNYPPPTDNGGACGTITCSPSSGSFFPVGTTTVTCSAFGQMCTFTVTVNDTQPPSIICPSSATSVTPIPGGTSAVVTYPPPAASDNCPGVTAMCSPPSGSTFPIGCTVVTCTATDAAGNTANCTFNVCLFNLCLQDNSNPNNRIVINSATGDYRFCCNGTTFTGRGKMTIQGNTFTLEHNSIDRRVLALVNGASKNGTASLQSPPGRLRCNITDSNTANNTTCGTCQ